MHCIVIIYDGSAEDNHVKERITEADRRRAAAVAESVFAKNEEKGCCHYKRVRKLTSHATRVSVHCDVGSDLNAHLCSKRATWNFVLMRAAPALVF